MTRDIKELHKVVKLKLNWPLDHQNMLYVEIIKIKIAYIQYSFSNVESMLKLSELWPLTGYHKSISLLTIFRPKEDLKSEVCPYTW